MVLSAPSPRSVTLSLLMVMPDDRLYVPALSLTTWFAAHAEIALLICAAVTLCAKVAACPGVPSVAQIVVRVGIPPGTPAPDQSILRAGARMLVSCALSPREHNSSTITTIACRLMIDYSSFRKVAPGMVRFVPRRASGKECSGEIESIRYADLFGNEPNTVAGL